MLYSSYSLRNLKKCQYCQDGLVFTVLPVCEGDLVGHARCDDVGSVYVDDVMVATTNNWLNIVTFTAPNNWKILAISTENHGVGGHMIIASLGNRTYTTATDQWKCSDVYHPMWSSETFNDSSWSRPRLIGGFLPRDAPIDPRAEHIWAQTGSSKAFCRTRNNHIRACNARVDKHNSYFINYYGSSMVSGGRLLRRVTARGRVSCGVICLANATRCHHTTRVTCVPPLPGCCGYAYDVGSNGCDVYTRVGKVSGASPILGPGKMFYMLQGDH